MTISIAKLVKMFELEKAAEEYHGVAYGLKSKLLGKSGPHSSRDEAARETLKKYPKAKSISTGRGNGGYLDIWDHKPWNIK